MEGKHHLTAVGAVAHKMISNENLFSPKFFVFNIPSLIQSSVEFNFLFSSNIGVTISFTLL